MSFNVKNKLIQKHVVDKIGTFYYFDNFMISELNEGLVVNLEVVLNVTNKLTMKHYGTTTPFVYISHRINSYSIQPTVHLTTQKLMPNTMGYAVVSYNSVHKEIVDIEKLFLDIPAKMFNCIEEAVTWANNIIVSS
ncbi:hypothetical protein MHTCC0001_20300 [Flavobacteriaceae bacterium MHTCC 0001]